ncbi:MAG: small ribosomal subunit biogenesis GTPase RsgA [Moorea sp. SIO3I7]|uniref:Small ribosomal subunit biogenesis GTPase RsgA n=1 Tax=Moorena bouillonii PNG TaxID=568701 RepID=A0A1U7N7I2_9CYAN|nr:MULTISPECIES: small ribosomal subunit biogenesis GTPase RsgA [Moorena]NEN98029.1 small ribosomal subunit biogenesis GTPase RsgA [Moorena sp. SIO3I7]NEO60343.1 small ribosomal subunit biogenesis GTPase RsgA [Moorena sp. SIO4G2]NEO76315.1 small ribosomal subunit biogenesis GTPase RsgA [Moorena sp. SIO4G3]OLT61901.1 ribosome small subunit-dependent GTPase A [Moorena bouillonii PNG]
MIELEYTNSSNLSTRWLGTVLAVQANFYQVRLDQLKVDKLEVVGCEDNLQANNLQPSTLLCTRRARLKKIGQQVMVGDRVVVDEPDWAGGRGVIAEVLPRTTQLDRPPIANAQQILVVFALEEPTLDAYQLSRFLVKAESTGFKVCLCLNKRDLVTQQQQQHWQQRLEAWGYQPVLISVHNGTCLAQLTDLLSQTISVMAGLSGVGKSSLINYLIPATRVRVAEVTGKLGRGRHTTRHVELFELPKGGFLADTPGFNQPDLTCSPEDLIHYFPEARERLAQHRCQFSNCLHRNEPNCAVRGDWERYQHYLDFLAEVIARQEALNQKADIESTMKLKIKASGRRQYEPKLETKKYRRRSRRTQHQTLDELYDDMNEG